MIAGRYELVRLLERGGMGTVWVAHNRVLDVEVGIKLIGLEDSDDAESLAQRLLEEARSAARLGHAAIVRVHDFGRTRFGDPFLAMELLEGEDLGDLLTREGRIEPVQAVQLLLPVAHALATAHERSIVHRDVKPENIFLSKNPEVGIQPKLLDFGIARILDRPRKLTVEGSVLGTPDYMSPEQARGGEVGASSDLWSFCVVLYEAVTGTVPFNGPNYNALLRAIIEDEPQTIAEYGIDQAELSSILSKGLRKSPEERWHSMRELGEALADWLVQRDIGVDITGTSLARTWFRNPEVDSWSDISQLSAVPNLERGSGPQSVPPSSASRAGALRSTPSSGDQPADRPLVASSPSDAELLALDRLGDPVKILERSERRRMIILALLFVLVVITAAMALLAGAGIVVF
jgi:serine/threonine-protein kinase